MGRISSNISLGGFWDETLKNSQNDVRAVPTDLRWQLMPTAKKRLPHPINLQLLAPNVLRRPITNDDRPTIPTYSSTSLRKEQNGFKRTKMI